MTSRISSWATARPCCASLPPPRNGFARSRAFEENRTRSLALEWAEYNINVNAVCPGGVNTPMLQAVAEWLSTRAGDDPAERLLGMHPRQITRHILPVEVGRIVAFLPSPAAAIIRGQAINVDAGDTPY